MKIKRWVYYKLQLSKLLPSFFSRFGWLRGSKLLLKMFFGVGDIRVTVPQAKAPVLIRTDESDPIVFWEVFVDECYKIDLPKEPKLILDGGANTGLSAVYFANRYPNARIIAVEPDQGNLAVLRENCRSYPNISVVESAIWGTESYLRISNPGKSGWGFIVEQVTKETSGSFEATTVSKIIENTESQQIDLLKLDIEGAERSVFSSEEMEWLKNTSHLVIELHDYEHPGCRKPVMTACDRAGLQLISEQDHVCRFTAESILKAVA